eukprot:219892-Chlamydomonas_euryale.AAC.3
MDALTDAQMDGCIDAARVCPGVRGVQERGVQDLQEMEALAGKDHVLCQVAVTAGLNGLARVASPLQSAPSHHKPHTI